MTIILALLAAVVVAAALGVVAVRAWQRGYQAGASDMEYARCRDDEYMAELRRRVRWYELN
jgi:hypothetical protein